MKNNLQFKNFAIEEKKETESGLTITGYGAVFGNVDSYGDIITNGAFVKTIAERKGRIAFCYQHDIWNPIGKIQEISEDEKGLKITVKISEAEEDIQTKIKEGILSEMSIGYRTMNSRQETQNGQQVNVLTEIKLIEVSLVTVAANPLAVIESMKSETEKADYVSAEFDRVLAIVKNDNINFEIQKLKSLVFSLPPVIDQPKETKSQVSKSEILAALKAAETSKNELKNALKNI